MTLFFIFIIILFSVLIFLLLPKLELWKKIGIIFLCIVVVISLMIMLFVFGFDSGRAPVDPASFNY